MSLFDRIAGSTSLFDRIMSVAAVLEADEPTKDPTKPFKYKSKNWDEKKHPRGKGGKFQKKASSTEPVAAIVPATEVPAVAPEPVAAAPAPAAIDTPPESPPPPPPPPEPAAPSAPAVDPAVAAMQAKIGSKFPPSNYQMAVFNWIEAAAKKDKAAVVIDAKAGAGKCLGFNTPVLMADGAVRPVQDVRAGDLLMGPDGEPRLVLSTSTGHGPLFEITPTKGDPWICNDVHVLTLVNSVSGEVFDIPLNEYLAFPRPSRLRDAKLFRVGVPFEPQATAIEPYLLGLWLGDGTVGQPQISTPDVEIHNYLGSIARNYGVGAKVHVYGEKCPRVDLTGDNHRTGCRVPNPIREEVVRCFVNGEKRIPENYLRNSREARLALLAGLVDTDGYYGKGYFEIITKYDGLCDDIIYLARSLGFAAYATKKIGRIEVTNFEGVYNRITIAGHINQVPCLVARKKPTPRQQKKDVLRTGFKANYIGRGDYYGFTLDRDGRFLLGDFTVTHNTTTIEQALKLIPKEQKVVFVAFNKHIADELARRTEGDDQVLASTLSSLGWAACRKAFPYTNEDIIKYYKDRGLPIPSMKDRYGKGPILDDNKVPNIIKRLVADKQDYERWASSMNDLIRLKKQYYSTDDAGKFNGPSGESIAAKHGIEVPEGDEGKRFLATAAAVWKESIADTHTMDFADQVFFPAMKKLPLADKRYGLKTLDADWVMVDESQDLSMTESTLIKRVAPRTVVVGDPNQSIYLFKGSDPTSMSKLKETLGADELPLSISYRCSKAVIAEAQKIVPSIESAPGAKEGSIQTIEWNAIAQHAQPGDQVLCRTNAPLVSECLKLIAQGKKAHIKGRDIGKSVEKTIKQIGGGKQYDSEEPIADFYKKVQDYLKSERARLTAADKEHLIAGLEDKVETILALGQGLNKVGQIIERINQIFTADKSPGVTFSTVHKAKGLEAEHVFIMRPDLLPFPNAKSPEEMQQEMNLKYVAITRSKDKLTWVKPPPKQPAEGGMGESLNLFDRVLAEAKLSPQQSATLSNLSQWFGTQPFLYFQNAGTWWARAEDKKGKILRVHPQVMDGLVKRGYVTRLPTPWENLMPHEKGYRRDLLLQVARTA